MGEARQLLEQLCSDQLPPNLVELQASQAFSQDQLAEWVLPWGLALWMQKRYAEALNVLDLGQGSCADNVDYQVICGMVARQLPDQEERAMAAYRRALALDPNRPDTIYNLANLIKDESPVEAEQLYRRSLSLNPNAAAAWHNLGLALNNQDNFREALRPLAVSLRLDPYEADVWCNLGLAWFGLEKFDEAERCFLHTISLDGSHLASHLNLGNALISALRPEQALQYLERGVQLEKSSTNALWNLGLACLLLGRYREGWGYYEARFGGKDFEKVQLPSSGPQLSRLDDLPKAGEAPLLVWSEQGLGDAIQFCRYLPLLEAAGVPFIFLTRPSLLTLMRDWAGLGDRVQADGSTDPKTEQRPHIALMSLPMVFGTELHTVPSVVPYLFPPAAVPQSLHVPPPPGGLAVGIVWASNPANKAMYKNKCLPLDLLMPRLLDLVDLNLIELHSLQVGKDAEQLTPWLGHDHVTNWDGLLDGFSDTAHVVNQLDLVISVDTAVAHLAGALNKPTWLLLHQNADFRWLKGRSDSPWYSSLRLFRQTNYGDWGTVIEQVKQAFDAMFLLDLDGLVAARQHK